MRTVFALATLLLLSACRLIIISPDTASVSSRSGTYQCPENTECRVDVNDFFFRETFRAHPQEGYDFVGWRRYPRALCGNDTGPCRLDSGELEGIPLLEAILFSDQAFFLAPNIQASFVADSLPCEQVPGVSPLRPGPAADAIIAANENPHKCTYVADNLQQTENPFGFDIRSILMFQLSEKGELGFPDDLVYIFDLAAATLQDAELSWPVLYLDIDADSNTGRSILGIGADYRMHYNFDCVTGESGVYEFQDNGWTWLGNGARFGVSQIGNGRFQLYGILLNSGFLVDYKGKKPGPPNAVLTIEEFDGDCGAEGGYMETSNVFSITNFYD